jgi:16S rRNA (adenine(1408)-N(1))-methyltransferase
MESLQGKDALFIDAAELQTRLTGYEQILIDLGTGDGRFVEHVAHAHPDRFVIGLDACRENLRTASRRAPCNALYLIANALALPADLQNLATEVTINFPWRSLLEGLLAGEAALLDGLAALARPGAHLAVRLNGGALAEAGWSLPDGAAQVQRMLSVTGFTIDQPVELEAAALRQLPTTWAKRLAFGRDPRALLLSGKRIGSGQLAAPPRLRQPTLPGTCVAVLTASDSVNTWTTMTAL